jgi:DNA-binding GntR family transcriptional regulator
MADAAATAGRGAGAARVDLWAPRTVGFRDPKPAQRGSDLIYRAIRQAIVSGRITPGTRLVEEDLADQFGVSRSPVREALRHLEYDGLAQRLRRGMLVAVPFSEDERNDIHLVRLEMDRLAARLAVQRATPEDWEAARDAVVNLGTALRDKASPSAVSVAHLEVHAAVNLAAFGGRLGGLMTRSLGIFSGVADIDYVQQPGYEPLKQHLELIDELASGDEARAIAAMEKHAIRGAKAAD